MAEKYKKLPGKKRGLGNSRRLWQGEDHLLHVNTIFFTEDYKRFYYKDIQAIVYRKSATGMVANIVLGFLCALFVFLWVYFDDYSADPLLFFAGLFFLILVANAILGPTCRCRLITAVQEEPLPTLERLRVAKKFLKLVEPLIEKAQGALPIDIPPELFKKKTEEYHRKHLDSPEKKSTRQSGLCHLILFIIMIFSGFMNVGILFLNNIFLTILSGLAPLVFAVVVIMAIVKQFDSNISGWIKGLTWFSLALLVVDFIYSYVILIYLSMKNPGLMNNQWELVKLYSELAHLDNPLLAGSAIYGASYTFIIGITGLLLTMKFRNNSAMGSLNREGRSA